MTITVNDLLIRAQQINSHRLAQQKDKDRLADFHARLETWKNQLSCTWGGVTFHVSGDVAKAIGLQLHSDVIRHDVTINTLTADFDTMVQAYYAED